MVEVDDTVAVTVDFTNTVVDFDVVLVIAGAVTVDRTVVVVVADIIVSSVVRTTEVLVIVSVSDDVITDVEVSVAVCVVIPKNPVQKLLAWMRDTALYTSAMRGGFAQAAGTARSCSCSRSLGTAVA